MKKILFVCTGNSCRSVMAEGLLKKMADKGIAVSSAGVSALEGFPATRETVSAMEEAGADVSQHRSRRLTVQMIHEADRVIVMERLHQSWVLRLAPEAENKLFLLSDFSPDPAERGSDLPDPIGQSPDYYRKTLTIIRGCVDRMIKTWKEPGAKEES